MDPFRLYCPVTVRPADLDSLGHINNAVYFSYLEMARSFYWSVVFGSQRQARDDIILARAELNYRAQAGNDHDLRVGIRTSRIGNSSFDFKYQIIQDETDRLIGEGSSVQVMFDYHSNRSVPMPDSVRTSILKFEGTGSVSSGKPDE